jgi:YesN/AraC family two-component response regulator
MKKTLKIKGMVCRRCIAVVKDIFLSQGLQVYKVNLGEITYQENVVLPLKKLDELLRTEGFEILTDRQSAIIQKVKDLVANELSNSEIPLRNFTSIVTENLHMEYDTVSALFSQTEGIKLEQYLISKRIEKVQGLLANTRYSLTDIAFQVGYSSVHHLSNQFKKITGMTPSRFRELHVEVETTSKQVA